MLQFLFLSSKRNYHFNPFNLFLTNSIASQLSPMEVPKLVMAHILIWGVFQMVYDVVLGAIMPMLLFIILCYCLAHCPWHLWHLFFYQTQLASLFCISSMSCLQLVDYHIWPTGKL